MRASELVQLINDNFEPGAEVGFFDEYDEDSILEPLIIRDEKGNLILASCNLYDFFVDYFENFDNETPSKIVHWKSKEEQLEPFV